MLRSSKEEIICDRVGELPIEDRLTIARLIHITYEVKLAEVHGGTAVDLARLTDQQLDVVYTKTLQLGKKHDKPKPPVSLCPASNPSDTDVAY